MIIQGQGSTFRDNGPFVNIKKKVPKKKKKIELSNNGMTHFMWSYLSY